jgi:hypothetical protein
MTLAVTTIGLVGLMSLHLSIARGNDSASRFAEATQFADAELESLRALRLTDMMNLLTSNPNSLPPVDKTIGTASGRNGMTYRRRVVITELDSASSSLWRIRVEVGWTDDGAAQGNPLFDHTVAVELIRTVEEGL